MYSSFITSNRETFVLLVRGIYCYTVMKTLHRLFGSPTHQTWQWHNENGRFAVCIVPDVGTDRVG